MRRSITVFALLALCITPIAGADSIDTTRGPAAQEALVLGLEQLFAEIYGDSPVQPTLEDHGVGLWSLTFRLNDEQIDRLSALTKGKSIQVLAVGHQISTPGSATTLISTVLSRLFIDYNYWFVVVNLSSSDESLKSTRKLKGPGLKFNRTANLDYPANTIRLYWDETDEGLEKSGVYLHQVKVTGAGSAKSRFFGQ